jgi:hypothetical protein
VIPQVDEGCHALTRHFKSKPRVDTGSALVRHLAGRPQTERHRKDQDANSDEIASAHNVS